MPAKRVLQYACDRCPNVWYVPEEAKIQPAVSVVIESDIPGEESVKLKFECLCDGCRKTVANLLASVGRVSKKVSANRKAKKKPGTETADKESPPPAAPGIATTTVAAPAASPVVAKSEPVAPAPLPKPSVISVPAVASGAVGKAPQLAAVHPRK